MSPQTETYALPSAPCLIAPGSRHVAPSPSTKTPDASRAGQAGNHREDFIIIPSGSVSITDAATDIFTRIAKTKSLFYRGGRIHEIAHDPDGTARLEPLTPSQFRSRVEQFGTIMAWRVGRNGDNVLQATRIPEDMARAMMESLPARTILPNISTLSACPVIVRGTDGHVRILGPGWHPDNGGIFITGGTTPPVVCLEKAVAALHGVLADFKFTTPGDRARAIASLIAPALKAGGWLENALPLDVGEADQSQSGKTFRQKCVAAVFNEKNNLLMQRTGGVGGLDESISQALIDARPFVLLDNVRGRIDSQFLEGILTAPAAVKARVPHRGEVSCDARNFIWQLTSNGAETTRDLVNRASIIRIVKQPADYKFAVFSEGDIYQHIVANQSFYLGCVFAVIQEWIAKGCLKTEVTGHDFREWSRTMDWFTINIFDAGALLDGHEDARARVCDPKKTWVRALALALKANGKLGLKLYAMNLAEFCIDNECLPPGFKSDTEDEAQVGRKIGSIMGQLFGQDGNEIKADAITITREHHYNSKKGRNVPRYIFRETA